MLSSVNVGEENRGTNNEKINIKEDGWSSSIIIKDNLFFLLSIRSYNERLKERRKEITENIIFNRFP